MTLGKYRFTCNYASSLGTWQKGDVAEFDDVTAQWLLRDVPGVIVPADEPQPAQDRQQRKSKTRVPKKAE